MKPGDIGIIGGRRTADHGVACRDPGHAANTRRAILTDCADHGPQSSNHRCSEPSIWISSPKYCRRARDCWMALRQAAARGNQIPASFIQPRNVSHGTSSPWCSRSFSRARVGPKSAYLILMTLAFGQVSQCWSAKNLDKSIAKF